ncbi:hypothetical protein DFH07DRAFT_736072, partial [Mycena maculata]
SYLYKRLVEDKEPLVSLGESPTRALSFAFAVMRGSLKSIWATRQAPDEVFWGPSDISGLVEESKSRGQANRSILYWNAANDIDTDAAYAEFGANLEHEMGHLGNFTLDADATKLPTFFESSGLRDLVHKHIFFQCPWAGWQKQTGSLIQLTVISAAKIQGPGDLLLFGLRDTSNPPKYEDEYDEPGLRSTAIDKGYKYLGKDKDLIKRCLRFGYRHWSETGQDIHHYMLEGDEFMVLAFVRMYVAQTSFDCTLSEPGALCRRYTSLSE